MEVFVEVIIVELGRLDELNCFHMPVSNSFSSKSKFFNMQRYSLFDIDNNNKSLHNDLQSHRWSIRRNYTLHSLEILPLAPHSVDIED